MPQRPFSRAQQFLLPPAVDDFVADDHPVRFVAAFVDALDGPAWADLGIALDGEVEGAPSYHPRALLSAWIYGFATRVRSARQLEVACRDQLPYLWVTGCQRPDHNTLWRFYQRHRVAMRTLLKRTVQTAVGVGLVDFAVQAVDGTKIAGNAAKDRTYDAPRLERLLHRTEAAIDALEAQNENGGAVVATSLPAGLREAKALRSQVSAALARVQAAEGPRYVNLTDGDAGYMKSRQGIVAGYNAQAVVAGLDARVAGSGGLLITAAEVVTAANDTEQLVPMLEAAQGMTGRAAVSVADSGYHSGEALASCEERGFAVRMPEAQEAAVQGPYHKEQFVYEAASDQYRCPQGAVLTFRGLKGQSARPVARLYRGKGAVCRQCPAFGQCTKDGRQGRSLEVGPYDDILRRHRALMATEEARAVYRRRKELVEPSFGILKEVQGARRFLLRGLANVRAEWSLLATAFNLRTLYRIWRDGSREMRAQLVGAGS